MARWFNLMSWFPISLAMTLATVAVLAVPGVARADAECMSGCDGLEWGPDLWACLGKCCAADCENSEDPDCGQKCCEYGICNGDPDCTAACLAQAPCKKGNAYCLDSQSQATCEPVNPALSTTALRQLMSAAKDFI